MAGGGVVLAATRDAVAMIRNSTLFLLTLTDGKLVLRCTHELLQSLPSAEETATSADDDANDDAVVGANTQHPPKQGIAATAFFQPDANNSDVYALMLLVDERKVVHYDADVAQGTVTLRSVRAMPRNATCMAVSSLRVGDSVQHMVIVGEKTGEAVAMPFPDLKRDLKTLLGHTTSMITHIVSTTSEPALLLTADRDEKIRVSHFPRVALVQSYCLGHTAALTKVACSVATPQLAVSTSLDNTIKLWHVASGALLDSHVLVGANTDASVQHNALRNVSLTLCAAKNVAVVVLPGVGLRFFAIESGQEVDAFQLVAKTLAPQTETYVTAHEPTDAAFTTEGSTRLLTIAYKQSPFLRVFEVTTTAGSSSIALSERSANEELTRLRKHAATIELPKEEVEETDDVDGGLTKKKIKLNNWKAKLPTN